MSLYSCFFPIITHLRTLDIITLPKDTDNIWNRPLVFLQQRTGPPFNFQLFHHFTCLNRTCNHPWVSVGCVDPLYSSRYLCRFSLHCLHMWCYAHVLGSWYCFGFLWMSAIDLPAKINKSIPNC